ncbi:methionyl-tRNA formyltransferase [Halosimplex marinum]|uniref:methionyl-tRNA formyltransferase n=1 Tax=Halosimplex marinum TaxID=3396620 RepID=UPI003F57A35E
MTAESGTVCYTSCTEAGYEVLSDLIRSGVSVDLVVSLKPDQAEEYGVSGYHPFDGIAEEHDIPIYYPETYEMDEESDVAFFEREAIDVMIVNGWQRLVRDSILDTLSIGAFGVHGSASGLPKGRGRSPMNWTIIEKLDRFLLSLIKLDEDADSGSIVATRKYDVNDHDTIRTMYYKLAITTADMLLESLPGIVSGEIEYETQTGSPTYYPKRTPEDGAINWHDGTRDIYDLIRAVARPYPGAFTEYDGEQVMIWRAIPFSTDIGLEAAEGEIVKAFETTGEFVVRTGDGTLLVQEWEADSFTPADGIVLESIGSTNRAYNDDHA